MLTLSSHTYRRYRRTRTRVDLQGHERQICTIKLAITEREERKRKRLEKKAAKVVNREVCQKTSARKRPPTTVSASTTPSGTTFGRQAYFRDLQVKLSSCNNYAEMKLAMPEKLPYPPRSDRPSTGFWMNLPIDQVSQILLTNIKDVNTKCLRPVRVEADGNCFPRIGSLLFTGNENNHIEMRMIIAHELLARRHLDHCFFGTGESQQGDTSTANGVRAVLSEVRSRHEAHRSRHPHHLRRGDDDHRPSQFLLWNMADTCILVSDWNTNTGTLPRVRSS